MALARTRRKTILLRPVNPSAAVELDFLTILNRVVRTIINTARQALLPAAVAEIAALKARDEAGANARSVIEMIRQQADAEVERGIINAREAIFREGERHTKKWTAAIRATANVDVANLLRDDDLVDVLSVKSEQFNALIRNLSTDVLHRVERETLGAIFEGRGNEEIAKAIQEIDGIGRRRARLIARDQASKLNGAMNQYRQEQAGVTHYKWRTVLDGRERPSHHANNGKMFPWNKAPAGTGHPGHEINCRCSAIAILVEDEEDLPTGAEEPSLREGDEQETIPARKLPSDGFAKLSPAEYIDQLGNATLMSRLDRSHFDVYSEYGYPIINRYAREGKVYELRGGKLRPAPPENVKRGQNFIGLVSEAIQRKTYGNVLPKDVVLYRGIDANGLGFDNLTTPGFAWRDPGFTSASRSLAQAHEFADAAADPVTLVIYAGGKRGLPIEKIAAFAYEQEVLLPSGTTFRVRHVEKGVRQSLFGPPRTYVHVDVVQQQKGVGFLELEQPGRGAGASRSAEIRIEGDRVAKPYPKAVKEAKAFVIQAGSETGNEWGVAHDADGRELLRWTDGLTDGLSLDVPGIRRAGARITVHHNHPGGSSFSHADILALDWLPGLERLYVHTPDGSEFAVSLARNDGIGVFVQEARASIRKHTRDALSSGALDLEAARLTQHWMMQALDRAGYVHYDARLSPMMTTLEERYAGAGNLIVDAVYEDIR